jgi:DNA-binding IclR family transcriptional regulator
MLLRRSGGPSTAREVTQALALSEQVARVHLETLTSRGLLSAAPGREVLYRCEPKSPALARYVDLLAEHYPTSRHAIHVFIATFARRSKSFAAAFRLRDPEN